MGKEIRPNFWGPIGVGVWWGRGGVAGSSVTIEGCIRLAECSVPTYGSLQQEGLIMTMVMAAIIIVGIIITVANTDTMLTMCQKVF